MMEPIEWPCTDLGSMFVAGGVEDLFLGAPPPNIPVLCHIIPVRNPKSKPIQTSTIKELMDPAAYAAQHPNARFSRIAGGPLPQGSKYLIIIYLSKTCTIITITKPLSTQSLGTRTLRAPAL